MKLDAIYNAIEDKKNRSAWNKGVQEYALYLLDQCEKDTELTPANCKDTLLNGAMNWHEYSWGGCAYIYDQEIAETLCNPTELKRTKHDERRPNKNEEWLDVQARALYQAANLIIRIVKRS